MKRTSNDRFLFLRNGIFTFKKRVPGQRSPMQISLNTNDRTLAREKRDAILQQLATGELDAIRGPRLNRAKVGAVLAAFRGVGALKTLTPNYVKQCIANCALFLRHATGTKPTQRDMDALDVGELFSSSMFAKFRTNYFADVLTNPEALKSRERGAACLMRHVHALFADDVRPLYRHLSLDWRAVDAWIKETGIKSEPRRHATLSGAAIREMHEAMTPFYEAWPDLWLVHVLHKFAGMRNEEICQIRVEWFERAPWGQMFIVCRTRSYYEFKGSDGSIPIHSSLVPLLAKFVENKQPTDFLLNAARPANWQALVDYQCAGWDTKSLDKRAELVDRIHAKWIKRWTPPEKFAKRGYELRRWAAQMMELKHGKDAAAAFLRHARGSVSERHYLEEWNQWRRLGNDLGITLAEGRGETNVEVLGAWTTGAAAFAVEGGKPELKKAG